MNFKKMGNPEEINLLDYVNNYLKNNTNIEILVGCDSQNKRDSTVYAVVVALYRKGKGAHVIYKKWKTEKERVRSVRLLSEVWHSIETAEYLKNNGVSQDVTYIDVDLNPDARFKSNEVFRQAVGMVEGMGYKCRFKSFGTMSTYAADNLVKVN
jgi:predicted RNase H-related nuclease YkuK (DUF458 family)